MRRIILILLVVILSGAGIFYFSYGGRENSGNFHFFAQVWNWGDTNYEIQKGDGNEDPDAGAQPTQFSHEQGRYINTTYGFSFALSSEYTARIASLGEDGEVLTFDAGGVKSFQIYVMPHDEPAINEERIRIDLPNLVMKHVRVGTLADTEVLVFNSYDASVGDAYEVWFVRGRYLFQIMTYADTAEALNEILSTWKFE